MAEHRAKPEFRPKPVVVSEPNGFTSEQLAAQREHQERQDLLRYLEEERIREFEDSVRPNRS